MAANWPEDAGSFGLKEPYFSEKYSPADYPTGLGGWYGDVDPKGSGNPYACQKVVDFGIRHLRETPLIAKKIINHYYGSDPLYSYYSGGSCGGKEGQISAQKLYDLYDGFYINCPLGGHVAVTFRGMWDNIQAKASGLSDFTDPGCTFWMGCPTVHSTYKAQAHRDAVYNKCDAVDGVIDGLIDDPRKCNFDALADLPACSPEEEAQEGVGGVYSSTCFTLAQRQALKEIYVGPHDGRGKAWYVGQPLGAEYMAPDWFGGLSSGFAFALNDGMAPGMFANIALDPPEGPGFDMMAFDWDKDPKRVEKTKCKQCYDDGSCKTFNVQDVLDAITINPSPAPNMGGFDKLYKKGGKIIQAHGWADALVSAFGGSSQFYETILKKMGPEKTKSFYKLYMVPGAGHCGGGIGYYHTWTQAFDALVNWVENGVQPNVIVGARAENVDPLWPAARTRPICPYPEVARYSGAGSIEDAANFMCVPPIEVKITPKTFNLSNKKGTITAKISVPKGYDIKDWNIGNLTCEGATMTKGVSSGKTYTAKFNKEDLVLTPGDAVTVTVKGTFTYETKQAQIQASDTIRVIE